LATEKESEGGDSASLLKWNGDENGDLNQLIRELGGGWEGVKGNPFAKGEVND